MRKKQKFVKSSGNVFKDMGFTDAHAKIALEKATILSRIDNLVREMNLSAHDVAAILEIHPTGVEELLGGRLTLFSKNRLNGFLDRIIRFKEKKKG